MNWVKTIDDKPVIGEPVLVLLDGDTILRGRLWDNGWTAFFADGERKAGTREVTHWMPLPVLPGEAIIKPEITRGQIAAMAMQGWLASCTDNELPNIELAAKKSVECADALLAELSKDQHLSEYPRIDTTTKAIKP